MVTNNRIGWVCFCINKYFLLPLFSFVGERTSRHWVIFIQLEIEKKKALFFILKQSCDKFFIFLIGDQSNIFLLIKFGK